MRAYLGRIVCLLSAMWLIGNVLLPPWVGRSYVPDSMDSVSMQKSGVFGLAKPVPGQWRPIWNPPPAYSPSIRATLRWPWQFIPRATVAYHVEIYVQTLLLQITFGLVVIGFAGRLMVPRTLPNSEHRSIHLAWCWAWAALVGCLLYLATWGITTQLGEAPPDTATLIGYAGLLLGASVYSLRSSYLSQVESVATSTLAESRLVSKSREKAVTLVVGLLAGGAVGWGLAMLILILFPSRPGPEYPGAGAAIGQLVVLVTGLVCGGVAGTLIALVRINQSLRVPVPVNSGSPCSNPAREV